MVLPLLTLLLFLVGGCLCGAHERRLLNELLGGYIKEARPTSTFDEPVVVVFGLDLQQIIDMDEQNQAMLSPRVSQSRTRPRNGKGEIPISNPKWGPSFRPCAFTRNDNRSKPTFHTALHRPGQSCAAAATYCGTSSTVVLFGRLAEGLFI